MPFYYKTHGTCSQVIQFDLDGTTVHNVQFTGGCNGNTQGVAKLCEGKDANDLIATLSGIRCGYKSTSCPDQLAQALKAALAEQGK